MNFTRLRSRIAHRRLIRILGLLAFLYISTNVYFAVTQVEKVLAPTRVIPTTPKRMGMNHEDVRIPLRLGSEKTCELHAFWIPVENSDAPILLYLHGQDATRGKNLDHADRFHEWGLNVLVIDYRGFAETYGEETPSEAKVYEDAVAALEYLKVDREIPSNKIFIYGHSLGGAVAIELATRKEAEGTAGLIVESTFTSILEMSALRYNGLLNLLPIDFLLTERFDSLSKIPLITRPILIIHGTEDPKVPHEMSQRLFDMAGGTPKKCFIEGAGHENCGSIGKKQYHEALEEFVAVSMDRAEHRDARGTAASAVSSGTSTEESQ